MVSSHIRSLEIFGCRVQTVMLRTGDSAANPIGPVPRSRGVDNVAMSLAAVPPAEASNQALASAHLATVH